MTSLSIAVSDEDHTAGPIDAAVTLVEYGDYECSYCGDAYPIVKALQRQLGTDLRFIFRNFPLADSHPHALHAAVAAEAVSEVAGEQPFWMMHDALYEHQSALGDTDLARYAAAADVTGQVVADALVNGAHMDRLEADIAGGARSGVNGTPTFFINGERYDGDWTDSEAFAAALTQQAQA